MLLNSFTSLDGRDSIYLHISHRVVLSADKVLFVKHRGVCVGVSVDWTHRL